MLQSKRLRRSTLKKHSNSRKKSEATATTKRAKSRGPVQRDTKEVLAELVGKVKEKLDRSDKDSTLTQPDTSLATKSGHFDLLRTPSPPCLLETNYPKLMAQGLL
jgi:hypothetical protein